MLCFIYFPYLFIYITFCMASVRAMASKRKPHAGFMRISGGHGASPPRPGRSLVGLMSTYSSLHNKSYDSHRLISNDLRGWYGHDYGCDGGERGEEKFGSN